MGTFAPAQGPAGAVVGGVQIGRLLAANFNVTTDQPIAIALGRYQVTRITVENASVSLTTAAGGFYTAAAKAGSAIVAAAQVYSALTASTKILNLTLAAVASTDIRTEGTLFFALTTPQGAPATGDIVVFGDAL